MQQPATPSDTPRRHHAPLPIIGAGLLSFGITLLLMSSAYITDLELLRRAPEAVWLFICGVPTDNEMVLPLMIGFAGLTFLIGISLIAIHQIRRISRRRQANQQTAA